MFNSIEEMDYDLEIITRNNNPEDDEELDQFEDLDEEQVDNDEEI